MDVQESPKTVARTRNKAVPKTPLPEHVPFLQHVHPHTPVNVNVIHQSERMGINDRLAVGLTKRVGTMWTAYSFALLALVGLLAILGVLTPLLALLVAWVSQTFIQLVLLPVIMLGQNILSRHAEIMAEEQFQTTQKTYHDIEEIMKHLDHQDQQIYQILTHMEAKS